MSGRSSWLLVVEDRFGAVTEEIALDAGQMVVGRSRHCDIVLSSENVSRQHARLVVEDGLLRVEDLGSSNGVWRNEQRVAGRADLAEGDVLRVGDFHLRVREGRRADPRAVHARLVGRSPGAEGQSLEVTNPTTLVGRGRDCGLVLVDPSVSRVHSRILVRPDASVLVEDVGSANGLFVNDRRVKVWQLSGGDRVRFGNVEFLVELPGSRTVQTPAGGGALPAWARHGRAFLLAGAVVGALGIMAALAAHLFPRAPAPGAAVPVPAAVPAAASPDASRTPTPSAAEVLARARDLVAARRLDDAAREVQGVLRASPANPEAVQLSNRIGVERLAAEALARADAALSEGRLEPAIQALFAVPPDSGYAGDARARLRIVRPSLEVARDKACAGGRSRTFPCLRMRALLSKVEAASR